MADELRVATGFGGAWPVLLASLGGFTLSGGGFPLAVTGFSTTLHQHVPEAVRGRVMAMWSIAFLGTRAIAALINGSVADLAGPRLPMTTAVIMSVAGAVIASRYLRQRPSTG